VPHGGEQFANVNVMNVMNVMSAPWWQWGYGMGRHKLRTRTQLYFIDGNLNAQNTVMKS
jgi:hypothetical protein